MPRFVYISFLMAVNLLLLYYILGGDHLHHCMYTLCEMCGDKGNRMVLLSIYILTNSNYVISSQDKSRHKVFYF